MVNVCIAACFKMKMEEKVRVVNQPIHHVTLNTLARYNWGQKERTPQRGVVGLSLFFHDTIETRLAKE